MSSVGRRRNIKGLLITLSFVIAIPLLLYGYYQYHVWSRTYRFRVTVTVATPDGDKIGSSVFSRYWGRRRKTSYPVSNWGDKVWGVAPIVDLGNYGTLVPVLEVMSGNFRQGDFTNAGASYIGVANLPPSKYAENGINIDFSDIDSMGKLSIPLNRAPQMVFIAPWAVRRDQAQLVLPSEFEKNIGQGVRLKSITLERTRDTLIERIPDAPEWLWSLRKQYAPGSKAQSWPSNIISFDIKQVESEFPPHFHDWSPSQ
jgi:hypothetical protein